MSRYAGTAENQGNLVQRVSPALTSQLCAKRALFHESLWKASSGWFQRP